MKNRVTDRSAVEKRIADKRQELEKIHREIQSLTEILNDTALIHAALPVEILTEFFILACEDGDVCQDGILPRQCHLGMVCRRWRKMILTTPRLWRRLCYSLQKEREDLHSIMFEEWINRSRGQSLDICLHPPPEARNDRSFQYVPKGSCYDPLVQASARWRSLSLGGPLSFFTELQKNCESFSFPRLSSVVFSGVAFNARQPSPWKFPASKVKRLVAQSLELGDMALDLDNIREAEIHFNVMDCLLFMEVTCSTLVTLNVTFDPDQDSGQVKPVVVMTSLTHLEVSFQNCAYNSDQDEYKAFFNNMQLPALSSLCIVYSEDISDWPWVDAVLRLIARSQCKITSLQVKELVDFHKFDQLLRSLPSIQDLRLEQGYPSTSLSQENLQFLGPQHQSQSDSGSGSEQDSPIHWNLPNLTHFLYKGSVSFPPEAIPQLLRVRKEPSQSRVHTIRPLKSFRILYKNMEWAREPHPNKMRDFYREIAALEETGIRVDFSCVD